jgi:thiamine-phosphate pyrophosphorylase
MIIAVTDRRICRSSDLTGQTEAVAAARPDMIILREKDLPQKEYERLAKECLRICDRHKIKFCVNSFTGTAAAIGSERIQMPFASFMANPGESAAFKEIWVSVHSAAEAAEAERTGATHLIFGNVFETACKPGAEGKGIDELRKVCGSVDIPVFAIGGIDTQTAPAAMAAGCEGVCVRSLLMVSEDPAAAMKELREAVRR